MNCMQENYFKEIIDFIKRKKPGKDMLSRHKNRLCKQYRLKTPPTDIEILLNADIKDISAIKRLLLTKPTRTISGVAVVAIMTKPFPCPHVKNGVGPCAMCPGGPGSVFGDMPQSYTGKEPATRRAIRNNYDAYLQVFNRLEQYIVTGHMPDKVELIVMGGTFPSFPDRYKEEFVTSAFKAMNDFSRLFFKHGELDLVKFKKFFELPGELGDENREKSIQKKIMKLKVSYLFSAKRSHLGDTRITLNSGSATARAGTRSALNKYKISNKKPLISEQTFNETSVVRCVGLTIETRPDYATLKHANEMLRLGATRVELGVQTIYNEVLEKINRGHTVEDSMAATHILKDLGFKINYHMMPGLPMVSKKDDIKAFKMIFGYPLFRPDMLKIYPCMVLKGTKLYKEWKSGKYKPLTTNQAASMLASFKKYIPEWCRVMRVQRDIPSYLAEAGVDRTNLRQYVREEMKKRNIKCRCIRCREIGKIDKKLNAKKIKVIVQHYHASNGNEFFISAEYKDKLLGFCRLRFPSMFLRKEITDRSALIRELHVYGEAIGIGKKGKIQHIGIGKQLLAKAEEIAHGYHKDKMVVISGVGARGYYKKLGYRKEGAYMVKGL